MPLHRRTGFTLVELVVVLVLAALLVALAAPLLRAPVPADPLADVIARARRLAVERAEPLALSVAATGRWRVASARMPETSLLEGQIAPPRRPVALALTPLGLCVPADALDWDPTRCEPATDAAAAAARAAP